MTSYTPRPSKRRPAAPPNTTPVASKPSLVDFAKANQRTTGVCAVCAHPQRAELEAARPHVFPTAMVKWLRDVHGDTSLTKAKLDHHFSAGHHNG